MQPKAVEAQLVEEVYTKLKQATGDLEAEYPRLEITSRVKNVAAYRQADNRLLIEENAIAICRSAQDPHAALAFLIGHELAHFYRNHDWEGGTHFLVNNEELDKHVSEEAEADVYGAFLAYLAGYDTNDIVPWLMDSIYRAYDLNGDIPGYPALEDRKLIAGDNCRQAERLLEMYEVGNRLAAAGYYNQASFLFDYVLQFVKNKSLYNNLGAVLLGQVVQLDQSILYEFPLEIDPAPPFRNATYSDPKEILSKSVTLLEKGVRYDPKYHLGYINLCIGYLLQGETERAGELLSALDHIITSDKTKGKILMLKGILAAKEGEADKALDLFREGRNNYPEQHERFRQNIRIVNNKPIRNNNHNHFAMPLTGEMNGVDPYSYQGRDQIIIDSTDPFYPVFYTSEYADNATISTIQQGDETLFLQWTMAPRLNSSWEIAIGQSRTELLEKWKGLEVKTIESLNDAYVWIPQRSLLVLFDQQGKVKGWGIIVMQ